MSDGLDLDAIRNFGTALLIGALVGMEREKRKADEHEPSIGGLRTFIVMALLGALGGSLTTLLHAPVVLVAVLVVAGDDQLLISAAWIDEATPTPRLHERDFRISHQAALQMRDRILKLRLPHRSGRARIDDNLRRRQRPRPDCSPQYVQAAHRLRGLWDPLC